MSPTPDRRNGGFLPSNAPLDRRAQTGTYDWKLPLMVETSLSGGSALAVRADDPLSDASTRAIVGLPVIGLPPLYSTSRPEVDCRDTRGTIGAGRSQLGVHSPETRHYVRLVSVTPVFAGV